MHPGWLLESEIVRAVSERPEGPYTYEETIFPARGPQYWDGRMTHNPHIMKYGNTWVLYYTGSTHPFADVAASEQIDLDNPKVITARANKRIGVAVADRITGPWKRFPEPILPTRPDSFDNLLTSNPAPCFEEDGSVLMMYKYRHYNNPPYLGQLHSSMSLNVAWADSYMAPYVRKEGSSLFPDDVELEDPFIWKQEGEYRMIAKDMLGNICGEKYGGVYARSIDGKDWTLQYGEAAFSRRVLWDDGQERWMGNMERPFILFENEKPAFIFFATSDGTNGFWDASKTWNMVIPLKNDTMN
ncbi:glycoside hydrolase family protein [Lachnoclostridium phytofermentans]|nr:glycoside hydrolase family protein [Lachnoclostridium phytofermentans]